MPAQYITRAGNSFSPFGDPADRTGTDPAVLFGEPLRSRQHPSVGELIERRIDEIAASPDEAWTRDGIAADNLAHALVAWEGKAAIGTVHGFCSGHRRTQSRRLPFVWPADSPHRGPDDARRPDDLERLRALDQGSAAEAEFFEHTLLVPAVVAASGPAAEPGSDELHFRRSAVTMAHLLISRGEGKCPDYPPADSHARTLRVPPMGCHRPGGSFPAWEGWNTGRPLRRGSRWTCIRKTRTGRKVPVSVPGPRRSRRRFSVSAITASPASPRWKVCPKIKLEWSERKRDAAVSACLEALAAER